MQDIKILGIPFDANSSYLRGAAAGPSKIRALFHCESSNYWIQTGLDLKAFSNWQEIGDISFQNDDPIEAFHLIEDSIANLIQNGNQVISLGGDHSIAYPIIKAHAAKYNDLHLLQIDAHGDLYDHFEGNKYSHACPFARIMEENLCSSLTQIGIRTLNQHQKEQAERFDVKIIEMKDFDSSTKLALQGPLYISLDLDAFDPAFAPGVSHHEPGGFNTREILQLIDQIDVPIIGADIVELNPNRDVQDMTAMLAAKLLKEILGKMLSSNL